MRKGYDNSPGEILCETAKNKENAVFHASEQISSWFPGGDAFAKSAVRVIQKQ